MIIELALFVNHTIGKCSSIGKVGKMTWTDVDGKKYRVSKSPKPIKDSVTSAADAVSLAVCRLITFMYYFKILNLLEEKKGEELTSRELFFILSEKDSVNLLAIKKVLTKMYLKNKHIERKWTIRD